MSLLLPTRRMLLLGGDGYLLREEWNGSSVSPGRWTRTDPENKITVASGRLSFSGGNSSATWGNPGIVSVRAFPRQAGVTLEWEVNLNQNDKDAQIGWSDGTPTTFNDAESVGYNSISAAINARYGGATNISVPPTYAASTSYRFRIVLKAAGALWYYSTDSGVTWKLLWEESSTTTSPLYPFASSYDAAFSSGYIWVFRSAVKAAVVSDTFPRDDSALTLGSAETGQAWVVDNGGFGISSNKAYVPTPTTNDIATVAAVADGIVNCDVTWKTSADAYVLARYADNQNFLQFGADNAGLLKLYKCVAGVFTDIGSYALSAVDGTTYSLRLVMVGAAIKGYVGGTERISVSETAGQTNTRAGIRNGAAVAGCRWDNFTVQG